MVGEYLLFFQNNRRSKFTIAKKIKLCFFTNLISQKFSDTVLTLTIAVSKRCTKDFPVVNTQGSRTEIFVYLPFGHSSHIFSKNTFSVE